MAHSEEELVKVGIRFKTRLLLEQAGLSETQARGAAAALGKRFKAARSSRRCARRSRKGPRHTSSRTRTR